MSKQKNLFYSSAELFNFALHKNQVDVYEIIEPKTKKHEKKYLYLITKEITKYQIEKLDQCGFTFCGVESFYHGSGSDFKDALWVQFWSKFD